MGDIPSKMTIPDDQSIVEKELMVARKIYEHAEEAILYTDQKSRILYVNPAFEIATGYSKEEVLGKNPSILKSGYHQKDFYNILWKDMNEKGIGKGKFGINGKMERFILNG